MVRCFWLLPVVVCSILLGDTLTLKSGRTVQGTYLGGDARQIRMAVNDRVDTYDVGEVAEIRFGAEKSAPAASGGAASPASARQASSEAAEGRPRIMRPDRPIAPSAPTSHSVEVPPGTSIVIRMIDDVDSERDRVGQTFRASLDEPIAIEGRTIVPRGADVLAKLIEDKQSGKLSGRTELTMDLVSITVDGRPVDLHTEEVTTASDSRTARTGKVVGGTAALGAIIGAIAGGGKGAAVGAVSGAGAGAAVQVLTKGQRVRIPSETRLTFNLQQPVRL